MMWKISLAISAVLLTSACQSSTPEREAGLFYNEMRLCIQNMTSQTIEERVAYGSDGTLVNDSGEQQDEFSKLLGQQAFVCYTTKSKISYPSIYFQLKADGEWSDIVQVSNSDAGFSVRVDPDNSLESLVIGTFDKQDIDVSGGKTFTFTLDQLPGKTIVGYLNGKLRTYPNGLKGYQMDLRITQ